MRIDINRRTTATEILIRKVLSGYNITLYDLERIADIISTRQEEVEHTFNNLKKEIERLKETEWMYNDLCK